MTYAAGIAAAVAALRDMAAIIRAQAKDDAHTLDVAAHYETAAQAVARLAPPEPAAEPCRCGWRVHAIECDCPQGDSA